MTKMTKTKRQKLGIDPLPTPKRNLNPLELRELNERIRLADMRAFEASLIAGNTALVPNGKEVAETFEAIARLMENAKNQWYTQKLVACGYLPGAVVNVNLNTGEITEVEV